MLAENIRYLRRKNNMSQDFVADKLGYKSFTTIQKWETGISEPSLEKLHELANLFNVNINDLINKDLTKPELEYVGTVEVMQSYKFIEDPIAAGSPEEIIGQTEYKTIQIPNQFLGKYAGNKDIIIMQVNGNSMNRIIPDDSLIGILPYDSVFDVEDGDIVVFRDEEFGYSVKRFYKQDNKIILRPESTDLTYTDIVKNIDQETVEILGKVIMYNVIL